MAKLEHQQREEEEAKAKAHDIHKPSTSKLKTSPITPFRAVNEPEPPGDQGDSAEHESKETMESSDTSLKGPSGDEFERLDSGSESDNLRSREEEHDLKPDPL